MSNFLQFQIYAIELPARGTRFGEEPETSLSSLTVTVANVIASAGHSSFAFFGYSLGALLAFEVARFLQQIGAVQPQHIFVSGGSAPQHRRDTGKMHLLSDDDFIDELKNYNGTPPAVTRSTFYSI